MMNKHIELVEKWLADPLSVSQAELEANFIATREARYAATAANAAAKGAANTTARWVAEYHKLIKEPTL